MCRSQWMLVSLSFLLSLSANGETKSEPGRNIGEPCLNYKCGGMNLICKNATKTCECGPEFTIIAISGMDPPSTLCLRPSRLDETCYHDLSCLAYDNNAKCRQDRNEAKCGCAEDYHAILDGSTGFPKCVLEKVDTNSDLATFIGVGVGMTLFCGMTCLVLRIFARARFGPRGHRYANAHLAPPTVITEPAEGQGEGINSRHSSQRSSIGGGGSRRQSMLAPPGPRPGDSRRASNSSIRSTSSARSYSLKNHQHHRPSDPETHLTPYKVPEHPSSANVSPRNHKAPQKDSRSSSTGAIALN